VQLTQRDVDFIIRFSAGGVFGAILHDAGLPLYLIMPALFAFTIVVVALDIFVFRGGVIAVIAAVVRWLLRRRQMGQTLDLNARRAARSEAENAPHKLVLGMDEQGNPQEFLLKPRMPLDYMDLLREERANEAVQSLLVNPADYERIRPFELDVDDLEQLTRLYGTTTGESAGSPRSSTNGGPTSNPPSSPTTDLILPVSAGERALLESDASSR
jgi:hypothetical protein